MKQIFKIKNIDTNLYWNGLVKPYYNEIDKKREYILDHSKEGKEWSSESAAFNNIQYALSRVGSKLPNWVVEESKLISEHVSNTDIKVYLETCYILALLREQSVLYTYFYDVMAKKGIINNIHFLFKIKSHMLTPHIKDIKEARAQLRLLGIKTRTFREHRGIFGMFDKDQAYKAKMAMDFDSFVDLDEIREKANEIIRTKHATLTKHMKE